MMRVYGLGVVSLVTAALVHAPPASSQFVDSGFDDLTSIVEGNLKNNAGTQPQFSIGALIEDICPGSLQGLLDVGADLKARCDEVWLIGGVELGAASDPDADVTDVQAGLQAMAPEEDAVIASSEADVSSGQIDQIRGRMDAARGGTAPRSAVAMSINGQVVDVARVEPDQPLGMSAGDPSARWGAFISGDFGIGDRDGTDRESGFDSDTFGFTAGVDYQFEANWLAGMALGYHTTDVDIDAAGGEMEVDSYNFFGYASFFPGDSFYVDGTIGYTTSSFDQERNIRYTINQVDVANFLGGCANCVLNTLTTVDQTASSETESEEIFVSVSIGREFGWDGWSFEPYVKAQYAHVEIDGFQDTMSNPGAPGSGLALIIDEQQFELLSASVGGTVTAVWDTPYGEVYPFVMAAYSHEFENDNEDAVGRFVDDPNGRRFSMPTDPPDRNYFGVGMGVTAPLSHDSVLFMHYQALLEYEHLNVHVVEAGLQIQF